MNIIKTIKNIRATCDDYIDPDLVATVIYHDNYIGTNNILDLKKYDINSNDNYEKRVLKVLNHENIFITLEMIKGKLQNIIKGKVRTSYRVVTAPTGKKR